MGFNPPVLIGVVSSIPKYSIIAAKTTARKYSAFCDN